MIVITGGAGFIGSTLANSLKDEELIIIDIFSNIEQIKYLNKSNTVRLIPLSECKSTLEIFRNEIKYFYHLGANSSTEQKILSETIKLNIYWSQYYWNFCTENNIPFMYASSAATYGNGSGGFSDQMNIEELNLLEMNSLYSWSKMYFDIFTLKQEKIGKTPPIWHGLKFFNVYGINEKHKNFQSSVVHAFTRQLQTERKIKLFRSYNNDYLDGEQKRDFVSVQYCIKFIKKLTELKLNSGLYNVGTGISKTFNTFAVDIMNAYGKKGQIEFIDMPEKIRAHYQYFTESNNLKSQEVHNMISDFNFADDLKIIVNEIIYELNEH